MRTNSNIIENNDIIDIPIESVYETMVNIPRYSRTRAFLYQMIQKYGIAIKDGLKTFLHFMATMLFYIGDGIVYGLINVSKVVGKFMIFTVIPYTFTKLIPRVIEYIAIMSAKIIYRTIKWMFIFTWKCIKLSFKILIAKILITKIAKMLKSV